MRVCTVLAIAVIICARALYSIIGGQDSVLHGVVSYVSSERNFDSLAESSDVSAPTAEYDRARGLDVARMHVTVNEFVIHLKKTFISWIFIPICAF